MANIRLAPSLLLLLAGVQTQAADTITAAGATFPFPIYAKWFQQFKQQSGGVQINYQSIGSGGGIQQLTAGTIDFGASDRPMSDEQIAKIHFKPLHFPTVAGAVVPLYNVPGVPAGLKFTGDLLAGIFMGKVARWNDPALTAINPGVKLPGDPIVVVVRSDSSGTTFAFTDYLARVSAPWKSKFGANSSVNWPVGLRAKGSEGVAGLIKQTPFAIGYVELTFAVSQNMGYGSVKNSAGKFVKAEQQSVMAAAASVSKTIPADFRVSIANAAGEAAYPISTFTWLLIPSKIPDPAKRKAITAFLQWMLDAGQKSAASLNYVPLPQEIVAKELKAIASIQ